MGNVVIIAKNLLKKIVHSDFFSILGNVKLRDLGSILLFCY